jgi:putative membrane protein
MGFPLPIIPLLFMVVCLAFMFFMMRGMMGGHRRSRDGHALDLLKERFARGEITQIEYEERRRLLET